MNCHYGKLLVDIVNWVLAFVTGTRVFVTACHRLCHRFEIAET